MLQNCTDFAIFKTSILTIRVFLKACSSNFHAARVFVISECIKIGKHDAVVVPMYY